MTADPARPDPARPDAARPDATVPDATGHFGEYGGRFVPEALVAALDELAEAHRTSQQDPEFVAE
ncbi:MAG: tryptophan synthase beta chain, partial [Pseudonocardiales bacterium]|nr:tryptophan synthase beta chain [Pseudonocardiales bacterium]